MGHVDEAMLVASARGPTLDLASFDFDGPAAATAYKVMVVLVPGAASIAGFAVVASQSVEFACFGERPHLVVDGGKRDVLPLGLEFGVEVLGGAEPVGCGQHSGEGAFLSRRALLRRPTR
jgi:hypothetical protein